VRQGRVIRNQRRVRGFIAIHSLHIHVSSGSEPDDWSIVLRVTLKATDETASKELKKSCKITALGQTRAMTGLSLSASGKWVIATAAHTVHVTTTSPKSKPGFIKYISPERLTCVTCHPTEDYFATGDVKGVIRLWYCLDERITVKTPGLEKKAQTTAWHWHAHAVSSLAFTSNGAYLLSGGEEAVLVIWQLHTGKKEFVPRVGAPITTISVVRPTNGEEEYLLGLADATYLFVSSGSLKVTRIFSRIKLR
jgi:NET1-associated nuclear protein 1 (U3 small nucleolar RNA-associated protein 17)